MEMIKFTSKLNKEDFEKFCHTPCGEIITHSFHLYVKYILESYGPSPEFNVDDFNFKGINHYSSYDYSEDWRKFLYKKFGTEYKNALKQYAEEVSSEIVNSLN